MVNKGDLHKGGCLFCFEITNGTDVFKYPELNITRQIIIALNSIFTKEANL